MYGPVIHGKLVRLRPPRPEDAALMITWFEDLEVSRFIKLRHPPSAEAVVEFLDKMSRDETAVFWTVQHEDKVVGGTSIVAINWRSGHGTSETTIADQTA